MGMRCDGVDVPLGNNKEMMRRRLGTLSGVSERRSAARRGRSRLPQLATRQAHEPLAALCSPLARAAQQTRCLRAQLVALEQTSIETSLTRVA